jgi:nifR3 family TIM-barrel protein
MLAMNEETNTSLLARAIEIGGLAIANRSWLAPMSGITDAPFRRLAARMGAGLVFSEMVAGEALVGGNGEMALKAQAAGLPVHAVQLAGREAKWLALAARMAEAAGAHLIDINMGCPAKRVTGGECGAALMRDLDHACRLIEAVVGAVGVPVTLKMRLGWDERSHNAAELAARAQSLGVRLITVHGRTRNQFYKGRADWPAIAAVRAATTLPLVVNGDIDGQESAEAALARSGADIAMTGRAACGAPWLPGEIAGDARAAQHASGLSIAELAAVHFEAMLGHYGIAPGLRQARKHLAWYADRWARGAPAGTRLRMLTATLPQDVLDAIAETFAAPLTGAEAA